MPALATVNELVFSRGGPKRTGVRSELVQWGTSILGKGNVFVYECVFMFVCVLCLCEFVKEIETGKLLHKLEVDQSSVSMYGRKYNIILICMCYYSLWHGDRQARRPLLWFTTPSPSPSRATTRRQGMQGETAARPAGSSTTTTPTWRSPHHKVDIDNLYRMVQYCEDQTDCRSKQLLGYFAEKFDPLVRKKSSAPCDNCLSSIPYHTEDVSELMKKVVQSISGCP